MDASQSFGESDWISGSADPYASQESGNGHRYILPNPTDWMQPHVIPSSNAFYDEIFSSVTSNSMNAGSFTHRSLPQTALHPDGLQQLHPADAQQSVYPLQAGSVPQQWQWQRRREDPVSYRTHAPFPETPIQSTADEQSIFANQQAVDLLSVVSHDHFSQTPSGFHNTATQIHFMNQGATATSSSSADWNMPMPSQKTGSQILGWSPPDGSKEMQVNVPGLDSDFETGPSSSTLDPLLAPSKPSGKGRGLKKEPVFVLQTGREPPKQKTACNKCRRLKQTCDPVDESIPASVCKRCQTHGDECVYEENQRGKWHKRKT